MAGRVPPLLRRAALIAERDLGDIDKAFGWIGDSLITHVDDAALGALDELGARANDKRRVEATLARALEEVFDGPLVRKLLARRASHRRDELGDKQGAATDLKKLHDLSPSDQDVMNELSALLEALGDHRGMINLYEDQILRGRDPSQRAELARKVARLWEEEIGDAREAADAWRRVLRMKAADPEATTGLERAKAGNLKKAPPVYERSGGSPSIAPSGPSPVASAPASGAPAAPSRPPSRPAPPVSAAVADLSAEVTSDGEREEVTPVGDRGPAVSGPPSRPTSSGPPTDSAQVGSNHVGGAAYAQGHVPHGFDAPPTGPTYTDVGGHAGWPPAGAPGAHEGMPPSDPYGAYAATPPSPSPHGALPSGRHCRPVHCRPVHCRRVHCRPAMAIRRRRRQGKPLVAHPAKAGYPTPQAGYGQSGYGSYGPPAYPPGYVPDPHAGIGAAAGWPENPATDPGNHAMPGAPHPGEHDDSVEDVDEAELIDDEDPKHRK